MTIRILMASAAALTLGACGGGGEANDNMATETVAIDDGNNMAMNEMASATGVPASGQVEDAAGQLEHLGIERPGIRR